MKYLILATILLTSASSAFALALAPVSVGTLSTAEWQNNHGGFFKNVSEAQDREDSIKARLDQKDQSEQNTDSSENKIF